MDPVDHPTVQNVVPPCLVAFVHHLQNFAGIKAMVERANPLTLYNNILMFSHINGLLSMYSIDKHYKYNIYIYI